MADKRTLPALVVKVQGSVLETNIDAFRDTALAFVADINTDLATDDDFAEAEDIVKWCSDAEKKIKTVKEQAMEQAADINAVFSALDDVSSALRDKRLALNKAVKAQKEERKAEAIDKAKADLVTYVAELEADLDGLKLPPASGYDGDLAAAAKGKKTLKGLNKALDKAVASAKDELKGVHKTMSKNVATLSQHKDHAFLFADAQDHAGKDPDAFADLVATRIKEHAAAEEERREREREAIREEERAKAEQAAAAKAPEPAPAPAPEPEPEPAATTPVEGSPHAHHTIDFIEISVVDLAAAKHFYRQAFGWEIVDTGAETASVLIDGVERYGLSKAERVSSGGVWLVLYSDALDKTAAAIASAGGTITKGPVQIADGRQLHFADPSGNEMAVWSAR
jgi:predicted enzyme related to lactoylglutathione lyase